MSHSLAIPAVRTVSVHRGCLLFVCCCSSLSIVITAHLSTQRPTCSWFVEEKLQNQSWGLSKREASNQRRALPGTMTQYSSRNKPQMRGFHTVTREFILLSGPLAPCLCSFIPILHKESDDSIYFKVVVILI